MVMRHVIIALGCLVYESLSRRIAMTRMQEQSNEKSRLEPLAAFLFASSPVFRLPIVNGAGLAKSNRRLPGVRVSPMMQAVQEETSQETSWQSRLDQALLNIDVEPSERLRLLQESLTDPALQQDVGSAFESIRAKGLQEGYPDFIDKLWPKGTIARSDLEGLTALRKQVPEVLEDLQQVQQSPPTLTTSPSLPDPSSVFSSLLTLATDSEKQKEFQEEAQDIFRSTPKGLEAPKYVVVRKMEGAIELREYDEFTVARTTTDGGFGRDSGATGFNTLASYLFGDNDEKRPMKMTMPVEMSSSSSQGSMSFVLPKVDSNNPPAPVANSDVTISKVPARLVAIKAFPGIVTDGEVERQKSALLEAIANDDSVEPVDDNEFSVLQYNSPFTIPWRRRNEMAIVVREKITDNEAFDTTDNLENSQNDDIATDNLENSQNDDGVASWYDSGVRL